MWERIDDGCMSGTRNGTDRIITLILLTWNILARVSGNCVNGLIWPFERLLYDGQGHGWRISNRTWNEVDIGHATSAHFETSEQHKRMSNKSLRRRQGLARANAAAAALAANSLDTNPLLGALGSGLGGTGLSGLGATGLSGLGATGASALGVAAGAIGQNKKKKLDAADSRDHVKVIRANGYGHGVLLGDAHRGLVGYGGGHGHGGGYGHGHGHGHGPQYVFTNGKDDCPSGVNPILGLALLGGLAAATAVLFTVITMMTAGKRRRRRGAGGGDDEDGDEGAINELINHVTDLASAGNAIFPARQSLRSRANHKTSFRRILRDNFQNLYGTS